MSNAIIRNSAPLTGHMLVDRLMASKVDGLFETAHDLFYPLNPVINVSWGKACKKGRAELEEIFTAKLARLSKQIHRYDGPFFSGAEPYCCDFTAFHHLDKSELLMPNILTVLGDSSASWKRCAHS